MGKEKYGLPVLGSNLELDVYPDLQDQWPEIPLLGTCSPMCETQPLTTDMYRYAERIRLTGIILSCAGLAFFVFYLCIVLCTHVVNMRKLCPLFCFRKSKVFFSLRHNANFRTFQSNRVAPLGDTNAGRSQERTRDRISDIVVRVLVQREDAGSTNNGIETDPPRSLPESPMMVEAAILSSVEEDDDDELSSMSSDGASSSDEEESSIDSFCYESNDETGSHGPCRFSIRHKLAKSATMKAAATE